MPPCATALSRQEREETPRVIRKRANAVLRFRDPGAALQAEKVPVPSPA